MDASCLFAANRSVLFYAKVVNLVVHGQRLLPALLLMADKHFFDVFLRFHHPVKFHLRILEFDMGIGVQRDADIRVTHDILQGFGVHAALCHVGAEGMAAHMGRDFRKQAMTSFLIGTNRSPFLVLKSMSDMVNPQN